jgi:very-short-patch-repair endonuclease
LNFDPSTSKDFAKFLLEYANLLRRDVIDIDKFEDVVWFHDIPQCEECLSGAWEHLEDSKQTILSVSKQDLPPIPILPAEIRDWVDEQNLALAPVDAPPLNPKLLVPDESFPLEDGESPPDKELFLEDHPEVSRLYDQYLVEWEIWAVERRRKNKIQKIYTALYRLLQVFNKQSEVLELVLGFGFLDWKQSREDRVVAIRRHAFATPVTILFDADRGVISLEHPSEGARLDIEDDMLENKHRPSREHCDDIKAELNDIGGAFWDKNTFFPLMEKWGTILHPDTKWSPSLKPLVADKDMPTLSFAPALILRKRRETGTKLAYETIIKQIEESNGDIPELWKLFLSDTEDIDLRLEGTKTSQTREPDDTFCPLPTNPEQLKIINAAKQHKGILVQGPPGTGKSHTIANLICHLLATGKRVLITAETSKALEVLYDKIPDSVKPLCISLLGQDTDQLSKSVLGITNKLNAYSEGGYDAEIREAEQRIDQTRRRIAELDTKLSACRKDEVSEFHDLPAPFTGTASQIAKMVGHNRPMDNWLTLPPEASNKPPVSREEIAEWHRLNTEVSDEDIHDCMLEIPESDLLWDIDHFVTLIEDEQHAQDLRKAEEKLENLEYFEAFRALSKKNKDNLTGKLERRRKERQSLDDAPYKWIDKVAIDVCMGRGTKWKTIHQSAHELLLDIADPGNQISDHQLRYPTELTKKRLQHDAKKAIKGLLQNRNWRRLWFFQRPDLKDVEYLRDAVFVDDIACDNIPALKRLIKQLDLELKLQAISDLLGELGETVLSSNASLAIAEAQNQFDCLGNTISHSEKCAKLSQDMTALQPPIPKQTWDIPTIELQLKMLEHIQHIELVEELATKFTELESILARKANLHNSHPLCGSMASAVHQRNTPDYSQNIERLNNINRLRHALENKAELESKLNCEVPGLLETILDNSQNDVVWPSRFEEWESIWNWNLADRWIKNRSDPEYIRTISTDRADGETELQQITAELVGLLSWKNFFERLENKHAVALRAWLATEKAQGKRTGKSAKQARLKRESRKYLEECREAVPIWIMPRLLVAEMVTPGPDKFDVLIIDEASQLGIQGLFLLYLATQVIVVGDDQQISPSGTGIADDDINALRTRFVNHLPHNHLYRPTSSIYEWAKILFPQNVTLREHFRCSPEIIQFSNDLCYASSGTPLDPIKPFRSDRLEPLKRVHVRDGYIKGTTPNKTNPSEAEAIVNQIRMMTEDTDYEGKTIGVISLLGKSQAKRIEALLLEEFEPKVLEQHQIICGDAYTFQGDERDVILLSMVTAIDAKQTIGVLANSGAKQRFNVAMSRAKEQVWLFHSVSLNDLSPKCYRHRLLQYFLNPARAKTLEEDQNFDSDFEILVYRYLVDRGFRVRTQVPVGDISSHKYRMDLAVDGLQSSLVVECDGDFWHGPDRFEQDMIRQRNLERAGWQITRVRGSAFYRDADSAMQPILDELKRQNIEPNISYDDPSDKDTLNLPQTNDVTTENRGSESNASSPEIETSNDELTNESNTEIVSRVGGSAPNLNSSDWDEIKCRVEECGDPRYIQRLYQEFADPVESNPNESPPRDIAVCLARIVAIEEPVQAERAFKTYLHACNINKLGAKLKKRLKTGLEAAIKKHLIVAEDKDGPNRLLGAILTTPSSPLIRLRTRGPRTLEEIPPSEINFAAKILENATGYKIGSEELMRAVLEYFDLKRVTKKSKKAINDAWTRQFDYVDQAFDDLDFDQIFIYRPRN